MASRPSVYRPVGAHGMLRLDSPDGGTLDLVADGDRLRLDLPDRQTLRQIAPRSIRGRRRALSSVARALSTHELTLILELAGKPVLRLGHKTNPSCIARLLGLAPAHIPFSAIRLLFR